MADSKLSPFENHTITQDFEILKADSSPRTENEQEVRHLRTYKPVTARALRYRETH